MRIVPIPAAELTAEQVAVWSGLQRADASLDSPYFHPEFTRAVATVRSDVEVGLLEDGGRTVGFFPFQRGRRNVAGPVGGKMSDCQGLIVEKGVSWDPRQLLRGCGLRAWQFDHLVVSQQPLRPYHYATAPAAYVDLSQGWEGYRTALVAAHKKTFKNIMRKLRRAEREFGSVRLELQAAGPDVFSTMIRWKSQQYRRTGVTDALAFDWTVGLLEQVLARRAEDFSGMLSALYFGDTLSAVLLGMRSQHVLHAWFPAHGPDPANLSPGLLLWMELFKACPALGIRRIDLGKGPEQYKDRLMSGAVDMAEGSVDLRSMSRVLRRGWHRVYDWARRSPLREPLLRPARFVRRMIESRTYRQ